MKHSYTARSGLACLLCCSAWPVLAQSPVTVVEDRGGASALPYYEALSPPPKQQASPSPPSAPLPTAPARVFSEADMLPVRSQLLSPGTEPRRVIQAPGLMPMFVIGDDDRSRAWLAERGAALREMNATGLVVNVESAWALAALRREAQGLTLSPVSGDDLAGRLGLRHYPVLITATGIEQ